MNNRPVFLPRVTSEPRTVVLHRSRKGFGFVLRGAKATSPLMELTPSARYPALQYLDDVDQGGVADLAGLRKGDYLIQVSFLPIHIPVSNVFLDTLFPQINGEDVTTASHEHVVDLIRKSGELVRMTVVSPVISLPNSQSAALLPTNQPIQRQYATLPRKGNNNVAIGGTLGRSPAPMPPRRDPKTTLSVGRARARSMVAGLGKENSKSKRRFDEKGLRNDFFSSGAQKAVGRGTIATKSHRRGLNRVARSPSIFPSSRRPDPTPGKTHRCSRGRPVSDRGPPPVGSPPRNWRYERIEGIFISRSRCSVTNDPLPCTPRMAELHEKPRLQLCPSFLPGTISAAAR